MEIADEDASARKDRKMALSKIRYLAVDMQRCEMFPFINAPPKGELE